MPDRVSIRPRAPRGAGRRVLAIVLTFALAGGARVAVDARGVAARTAGPGDAAGGASPDDSLRAFYDSLYADDAPTDTVAAPRPAFRPFDVGERFVYTVRYGLIKAGTATLEVRNLARVDSAWCWRIVSDARSNRFFSKFYRVRDRYVSLMDTTELYSRQYEKHIREGKYRRDERVRFDQRRHLALYDGGRVLPIAPRTQDVLSAMYYIRTVPLEIGKAVYVANHTDGRNYPLVIRVLRRETIEVEAGRFDCIVVEPILRGPGLFTQKGRLTVWLTDDRNRLPVLMRSRMIIGHVSAVLREYTLARR